MALDEERASEGETNSAWTRELNRARRREARRHAQTKTDHFLHAHNQAGWQLSTILSRNPIPYPPSQPGLVWLRALLARVSKCTCAAHALRHPPVGPTKTQRQTQALAHARTLRISRAEPRRHPLWPSCDVISERTSQRPPTCPSRLASHLDSSLLCSTLPPPQPPASSLIRRAAARALHLSIHLSI